MTLGQSTLDPTHSRPTLDDINRRYRELLAYKASRKAAQPDLQNQQEEQQEPEELQYAYPEDVYPDEDTEPSASLPWESAAPPPLALPAASLYGIAGRVVSSLAPHTEADPAAILLQFLAAFGNLVGPAPHCRVGATRHGLNLFVVLVGESSKARKGTSWRQIFSLLAEADPLWSAHRVTTTRPTLTSILHALRDQPSVADCRLFLLSEEFASVLHTLGRESGQLSPLLRRAWDGGDLCGLDSRLPVQATAAHISLVGHVTKAELAQHLNHTEAANGFANRCLWTTVRRSKSLPDGGSLSPEQQSELVADLRRTLDWVRSQNEILLSRTPAARELWNDRYDALSQGREDAYGAATSRAEAQVLRLSAIYAALDSSPLMDACHLQAAFAVWDYCSASARLLFDTAPIDPTARRIIQALEVTPGGLSRAQLRALFNRHVSKERIDLALEQLMTLGLIHRATSAGERGRPATLWTKVQDPKIAAPGN